MKNLQKAIEEIKAAFQSLRIKNNLPRVWQEELNRHGIDIDDWFEKELTQLITSREQEIREEAVRGFAKWCDLDQEAVFNHPHFMQEYATQYLSQQKKEVGE